MQDLRKLHNQVVGGYVQQKIRLQQELDNVRLEDHKQGVREPERNPSTEYHATDMDKHENNIEAKEGTPQLTGPSEQELMKID